MDFLLGLLVLVCPCYRAGARYLLATGGRRVRVVDLDVSGTAISYLVKDDQASADTEDAPPDESAPSSSGDASPTVPSLSRASAAPLLR